MSSDEYEPPIAGQIWRSSAGFEVRVTRVSDEYVHYDYPEAAGEAQLDAVEEYIKNQFDHAFVSVSRVAGTVKRIDEFCDEFEFARWRDPESYESGAWVTASETDTQSP